LVEHLLCKQGVGGSSPLVSTSFVDRSRAGVAVLFGASGVDAYAVPKEGAAGVQLGPADAEGLRGEVPVGCLRSTYARR
jgi:hypothetical protein